MSTVLDLGRVKKHFAEERANKSGLEKTIDVQKTVEEKFTQFAKEVYETRKGSVNKKGKQTPGRDVSLEAAALEFFGSTTQQLLRSLGIYTGTDTISSAAERLGMSNLNKNTLYKSLEDHGNYGGASFGAAQPHNTAGLNDAWRFLIPEVIMAAVRTGYTGSAQHPNWTAGTQNLAMMKATMPQLLRGNTSVSRVNEGANIPLGSVRFGQKSVDVYKVGTGFSLTDELIDISSMDLVSIFLQEVGTDMAIGGDWAAMQVLINGEQPNGSESAPVVGVLDPTKGFQYGDFKKAFSRGKRLGIPYTRVIAGEDDAIDVTSAPQFQGYAGESKLANISTVIGVPERFDLDAFVLPEDQVMLLNPQRALMKLTHRGMLMEDQRNIQNQTSEIFVSDYINFSIIKRDARLLLDKSQPISLLPYPAYMDIDKRIRQGFLAQ
jgi:hypothetical protein